MPSTVACWSAWVVTLPSPVPRRVTAGPWASLTIRRPWPRRLIQVVAIGHGGLASSAVGARTWRSAERELHHIVDPRTGDCAEAHWSLVSATGASCVEANLVTTASLVWGAEALDQLRRFDQSVRLVRLDGRVFSVNGWPHEETT